MYKYIFLALLEITFLNAATLDSINISLSNILLASELLIIIALFIYITMLRKKDEEVAKIIKEKDEKIEWLRKVSAQKEFSLNKNIKDLEDKISDLNHQIEKLEQNIKEGTKNQVIMKLDSLKRKREELLNRLKD